MTLSFAPVLRSAAVAAVSLALSGCWATDVFTTAAVAQQPAAVDPARTDSVVQQALRSYQTGLDAMRPVETAQPGTYAWYVTGP